MVFYIRHVYERSKGNLDLMEGSVKLCSKEGLLDVYSKSRNVPQRFKIGRLMSL